MEVDVRDARPEDAPAVANLLDDLGYPASAPDAGSRLRRLADDPASRILVAVDSGNVVGSPRSTSCGSSSGRRRPRT